MYPDQPTLAPELWEQDIRAICLHDLPDLIETIEQDAVNLVRRYHHIFDVALGVQNQLMQLLLRLIDGLLIVSSDVNLVFTSPMRSRRSVAVDARKWRWKVDGGVRSSFDKSDVLPGPPTDNGM